MLRIILLLAVVSFAGPTAKRIVLPSGETGYSIRCDNENINACYELAGEVCFRGYAILNQNTQQGFESKEGAYVGPGLVPGSTLGLANSSSSTTSEKGFLIQCKDPEVTEFQRSQRAKQLAEEEAAADKKEAHGTLIFFGIIAGVITLIGIVLVTKG